jgi:hypothetical protein
MNRKNVIALLVLLMNNASFSQEKNIALHKPVIATSETEAFRPLTRQMVRYQEHLNGKRPMVKHLLQQRRKF